MDSATPRDATTIAIGGHEPASSTAEMAMLEAELREAIAPELILLSALGEGGMGTVFLARDPALKRNVVVKALRPELAKDPDARKRFEREAQAAATVSHANVVGIYRVGQLPRSGTSYFVMQHVTGPTLEGVLQPGSPMPEARARRILGDIASALAAAHAAGVVHRDIKPANVMIESATDRVVVLDFGISAITGDANRPASTKLTQQGASIGTPRYMSPEQASGEEATEKSDVYSLGLVGFELLTGRPAFEETSVMGFVAAHINKVPPKVADIRRDVDRVLGGLIDRTLEKDQAKRPTAAELARALTPERSAQVEWPPPGVEKLQGAGVRVLRAAVLFVAGLLALQWFDSSLVRDLAIAMVLAGLLISVLYEVPLEDALFLGWRSGYPFAVLADVALDGATDTRDMVGGTGAYATIPAGKRAAILRRRRWAAAGIVAGAAASLVLAVRHAADPLVADRMQLADFAAMAWPLVAALALDRWVAWRETALRGGRRIRFAVSIRRRVDPAIVNGWLASAGRKPAAAPGAGLYGATRWALVGGSEIVVCLFVVYAMVILMTPRVGAGDATSADELAATLAIESQMLQRVVATAQPLTGGFAGTGGPFAAPAVLTDSSPAPSAAVVKRAWSVAPKLERGMADTLRAYASARELVSWRAMAGGRIPAFFYWPADTVRMRDSTAAIAARAADFMVNGAWRNAAAAAVALADGDAAGARARLREIARVGTGLAHDPRVSIHDAGLSVLAIAADAWRELARVAHDSVQARQARDLAGAASGATASSRRTGRTWGDALGQQSALDSAHAGVWRTAVRNEALPPFLRSLAIDGLILGVCGNRQEMLTGPSPRRRALLAELPALIPPGETRDRALALGRWREKKTNESVGYRYGYCGGKRTSALL